MGKVVAIDGPSGAGKSTLAKALAGALGFEYLDTGALYRAAALCLKLKGATPEDDDEKIAAVLKEARIDFMGGKVYLNGTDVSEEIRTKEAGHYSSVFSARKPVRDFLLPLQRSFSSSSSRDLVVEGRDMTTVVFPGAWKKFYLDASLKERARRRFEQMAAAGRHISMEDAMEDVALRDNRDSSREIAPLKRSEDAFYLDTTDVPASKVLEEMLKVINVCGKTGK
ncbi:MAG: (d)CMP kinase [Nitrospiraceae bacterium]|nr:(d)CMP kinase [Nitrospiraceae bacterium]